MASKSQQQKMVRVVCEACGTDKEVPIAKALRHVTNHNNGVHGGNNVAGVVGERPTDNYDGDSA